MTTTTAHTSSSTTAAGEFIAIELAWNGSATDAWIANKLASAGFNVDPTQVTAFAVQTGLLRPIPRLGGYTVTHKVNARTFGVKFANWVAE